MSERVRSEGEVREARLAALRRRLARVGRPASGGPAVSTGLAALDRLLAPGGLLPGELVEWRGARGSGVARLAWHVVGRWLDRGGLLAVIDAERAGFPPAWHGSPWHWREVVWIRPATLAEAWLAWEESLRSPGVAAVWGWISELPARHYRRLQLACERGGHVGMLLRPPAACRAPSWATVIWEVEPLPTTSPRPLGVRSWRVRLVKSRSGVSGVETEVTLSAGDLGGIDAVDRGGWETWNGKCSGREGKK